MKTVKSMSDLGKVIHMAKYDSNETEPKGIDDYATLEDLEEAREYTCLCGAEYEYLTKFQQHVSTCHTTPTEVSFDV